MTSTDPLGRPSNEASAGQLAVARAEGDAYRQALRAMAQESGAQTREAGDYLVAVVVEEAEGLYAPSADRRGLDWHEPDGANAHLEVAVADRHDGRFVPGLDVTVQVRAARSVVVMERRLPFLWHPFLHHYGTNLTVEEAGYYTVSVRIAQPSFHRHDPVNGRRYVEPVEVTFDRVRFEPGAKHSPEAEQHVGAAR